MSRKPTTYRARTAHALPLILAALASAPAPASAQLPDAEQVVARYIDAIGGEAALRKHQYRHDKITMAMPAQGITVAMEIFAAAPNLYVSRMDMAGIGTVATGFNGTVGWMIHPATGPMVLDGAQLEQQRQQASFYGPLDRHHFVKAMETVERTDFEGRPCYRVKITTNWDEDYFEFYDVETGLLAGAQRSQESMMGPIESTTIIAEYREVGGVKMPARITTRAMGMEQAITIESSSFEAFDRSVFELPPEIKALVK